MSETAPEGIYVYQPFAPSKARGERLYALGGLPLAAKCEGLTKDEAEAFADALNDICWMGTACVCGRNFRFAASHCPECGKKVAPPWKQP